MREGARKPAREWRAAAGGLKLRALALHPIQYQARLWASIAEDPRVLDFEVWFGWAGHALESAYDPQFGETFRWDVDLTAGYKSAVLSNWSRGPERAGPWSRVNPSIVRRLVDDAPDGLIVIGHGTVSAVLALAVARSQRIPTILYGDFSEGARPWLAPLRRVVVRLAAMGGAIGGQNEALYAEAGFDQREIVRIPFGVDNRHFQVSPIRPVDNAERPLVVLPAKMVPWKGHDLVLEALSSLQPDERPLVAFVGTGPLEAALRRRVVDLCLEADVRWVGMRNYSEMPSTYAEATATLLPSSREAWGLVLNESMAAGRAVIVSNACGAAGELVKCGENGEIFASGDAAALASILASVRTERERWKEMGRKALSIIEEFDVRVAARRFIDAFEHLAT